MSALPSSVFDAFFDEFAKIAFRPSIQGALGLGGALGGIGAGAGGLVGAGIGGVKAYRDAKEQGAGTGQAIMSGVMGAGSGAATGAGIGAGIGALGGGIRGAMKPQVAEELRKKLTDNSAFARFGQRQVHAATGWTPKSGPRELRMDAWDRKQSLDSALQSGNVKEIESARKAYDVAKRLEGAGMTSLPGLVKGLATSKNRVRLGKDLLRNQVAGMGAGGLALTAMGPGIDVAGAVSADTPEERSAGLGRAVGNLAGNVLMGPLPAVSQAVFSSPLSSVGEAAGRRVGKLFNRSPTPHPSEMSSEAATAIPAVPPRHEGGA